MDAEKKLYKYGELVRMVKEQQIFVKEQVLEKNAMVGTVFSTAEAKTAFVQKSKVSDPVFSTAQILIDVYDERIRRTTEHLGRLMHELDRLHEQIDWGGVSGVERSYIQLRYVEGFSNARIADKLGYSERWCRTLRTRLLQKLGEKDASANGQKLPKVAEEVPKVCRTFPEIRGMMEP
jgi:hypothetical protein